MEEYIPVAEVKKPHGLEGEVRLWVDERYEEALLQAEVLFLGKGAAPIPFFVEYLSIGPPLRVKLEEVNSREEAASLRGQQVHLPASRLATPEEASGEEVDHSSLFDQYVGAQLKDLSSGPVGRILEIREYPGQWMAVVEQADKEILIPMHEALIVGWDPGRQVLDMDLPEGLLDL